MKSKASIWIVDDDADDREIIRDAFQANNHDAAYKTLESGDALLQYLNENKSNGLPALILLDLNMPGKDGREALKEIKNNAAFQKIPIIVFTTSSSDHDKQISYDYGANCFVTKPDTFDKLVDITGCILKLWAPPH